MCQECTGYKRGEQCEDECPTDHYADDERRECFACHEECRGCSGPGPDSCVQCHNFKIFDGDPNDNSTSFNCTATCPPELPHKVYNDVIYSIPYCSASAARAGFASGETETIMYLAIAFIVLLLLFAALIISSLHCRQKAKIKKEIVNTTRMLSGCEDAELLRPSNVGANLSQLILAKVDELSIGVLLGRGAFGEVYRGYWSPEHVKDKFPVAIKQLTNVSGDAYGASKEFLDEAMIMATVHHENILPLLAVCMADKMMLITQLMTNGSLLEYVKARKNKINSYQLLSWSTQIAKGMAYLEERRLVHRDLAARNVLVSTQPRSVKIADFGLAKLLSNDSDEYKAAGGKMPIKWLALECIRHRIFTTKSDVWAFGVTIWELLTFGKRPFEDIAARDVPEKIEAGEKLKQPDGCSLDVYCTLLTCWQIDADSRPTFKDLVADFQNYASDPGRYLLIQGDTFARSPQYTGHDEKGMISTLARQHLNHESMPDAGRHANRLSQSVPGPSNGQPIANTLIMYNLGQRGKLSNDDETDSNRDIGVGNIRLDLPLDDDDYLMPTCQSESNATPSYMDLLGTPAPACVDNPEYLMNTISTIQTPSTSSLSTVQSAAAAIAAAVASSRSPNSLPTQTIGIPIGIPVMNGNGHPMENVEQDSDREYYNDLQRELQPLQTNETTV